MKGEVEPPFGREFPTFVSVINGTFCWMAEDASVPCECLAFIPHCDGRTALSSCCFQKTAPHCVEPLKDIRSQCPAFPHPRGGSPNRSREVWIWSQALLSCDQERHLLTGGTTWKKWKAGPHRETCAEASSRGEITVLCHATMPGSFCHRPGFFPAHLRFPYSSFHSFFCLVEVQSLWLESKGMVTSIKYLFFCVYVLFS